MGRPSSVSTYIDSFQEFLSSRLLTPLPSQKWLEKQAESKSATEPKGSYTSNKFALCIAHLPTLQVDRSSFFLGGFSSEPAVEFSTQDTHKSGQK